MSDAQDFSSILTGSLPLVRLGAFRRDPKEELSKTLSQYLWNVQLCEAMYPSLHYFEIGLRNNVDNALAHKTGKRIWYDTSILMDHERDAVEKAIDNIIASRKVASPDRVIAELSLGFWINLFSNTYEEKLWSSGDSIKRVFPCMPKFRRKTSTIGKELEAIRAVRNRVFHHEPIWKSDLRVLHTLIDDYTGYINPSIHLLEKNHCRLISVLEKGPQGFQLPS